MDYLNGSQDKPSGKKYSLLSYVPAFLPQLDFVQLKDKNLTVNMLHVAPFIQILYLAKTDT